MPLFSPRVCQYFLRVNPSWIIPVLLLFSFTTYAQQPDDRARATEFLQQQEQRKKAILMQALDSGVLLMENAEYAAADKKFKRVLDNVKGVPSDLTFYFGKNSFYLEKYKQSIDWLNKYIQLKGVSGQYSQEAVELKKKAEQEFVKQKSKDAQKVGDVLSMDYDIDCGPTGKVTCPVCKGDHVIVKKGTFGFGDEYKTCPYCNEHGILSCEEYNKLIRGQLKPRE